MPFYRKKPVVIEAVQFGPSDEGTHAAYEWAIKHYPRSHLEAGWVNGARCLFIETLEGQMRADLGDFIIKGVKGELYPCKADIFVETYEEANPEIDSINNGETE